MQEEKGLVFTGADEYYSFIGFNDGYFNLVQDPYKRVNKFPFKKLPITKACQECYLLGFLLGKEVFISESEESKNFIENADAEINIKGWSRY